MFLIDTFTYDKARLHPLKKGVLRGYQARDPRLSKYKSIIVHTTNGKKGSTFHGEAMYLVNSNIVSAGYLIGKDGRIARILDPVLYTAWHTGNTRATLYSNPYAIGIEMHRTPEEGHITTQQFTSLDWLVRQLLQGFAIDPRYVDTHRYVAIPAGRKIDPSGFSDAEFYAWKATFFKPQPIDSMYRVNNIKGIFVRQSPQVNDHNVAGTLNYNDIFIGGDIKNDELGEYRQGTNKWIHLKKGTSNGVPVDGLGFIHMSNVVKV
jgi:hypothetical protein